MAALAGQRAAQQTRLAVELDGRRAILLPGAVAAPASARLDACRFGGAELARQRDDLRVGAPLHGDDRRAQRLAAASTFHLQQRELPAQRQILREGVQRSPAAARR